MIRVRTRIRPRSKTLVSFNSRGKLMIMVRMRVKGISITTIRVRFGDSVRTMARVSATANAIISKTELIISFQVIV